jgi:hypothetical protein
MSSANVELRALLIQQFRSGKSLSFAHERCGWRSPISYHFERVFSFVPSTFLGMILREVGDEAVIGLVNL